MSRQFPGTRASSCSGRQLSSTYLEILWPGTRYSLLLVWILSLLPLISLLKDHPLDQTFLPSPSLTDYRNLLFSFSFLLLEWWLKCLGVCLNHGPLRVLNSGSVGTGWAPKLVETGFHQGRQSTLLSGAAGSSSGLLSCSGFKSQAVGHDSHSKNLLKSFHSPRNLFCPDTVQSLLT